VENNFKSSAYLAWNEEDFSGNESGSVRIGPLPPLGKSADRKKKTRRKFFRGSMSSSLDSAQSPSDGDMDTTMIPANIVNSSQVNVASTSNNSINSIPPITDLGPTSATSINSINIEEVFPAPDVIIRDLFELYKDNKKVKEKDLALLNYVKLLFNRLNS